MILWGHIQLRNPGFSRCHRYDFTFRLCSRIGSNNKVTATAFALGEGKLSGVIEHGENYYIVKTLYKEGVDSIPWDSPEIEQIKDRLTQQSKQKVYYDWYIAYKNKSDIKSNVDDLYLD
jgi:hypothetical protein